MRVAAGVGINLLTILFLEYISAMFFWALMLTSYFILLEALWGCSMLHWVVKRKKDPHCTVCKRELPK